MNVLSLNNICLEDGQKTLLKRVSLEVRSGELVALMGPSGSGKSTLLKVIASLKSVTSGEVLYKKQHIDNYQPTDYRKSVRYVPQSPELFAGTVRDNLAFVYLVHRQAFEESVSLKLLSEFGLSENYLEKDVANLSGGEKQRIGLIRSLLFKPEVLLLDEPTSSLDQKSAKQVETVLRGINSQGVTMLWVTHSDGQANRVASRVLRLESGQLVSSAKEKRTS